MKMEKIEMTDLVFNSIADTYNLTDAAISELSSRFAPLEITDGKSYKTVATAIGTVRGYRVLVEKKRKELKKDALSYGRRVDGEAKRITGLLEPIESGLKAKKQAVDDAKAAEKAEKARIDAERVAGILKKISGIRDTTAGLHMLNSGQLKKTISRIEAIEITPSEYLEFTLEAKQVKAEAIYIVNQSIVDQIQIEEEDAARKAESERLKKIRLEQEVESKRLAEAKEKIDAANLKIEQDRQRLEDEKQADLDRKEREALEKRIAADAKVQAEKDAEAKIEREERDRLIKKGVEAAEKIRLEALAPDKVKLGNLAGQLICIQVPGFSSSEAQHVSDTAMDRIGEIYRWINNEIKRM